MYSSIKFCSKYHFVNNRYSLFIVNKIDLHFVPLLAITWKEA